jgi:hypothetical protein
LAGPPLSQEIGRFGKEHKAAYIYGVPPGSFEQGELGEIQRSGAKRIKNLKTLEKCANLTGFQPHKTAPPLFRGNQLLSRTA